MELAPGSGMETLVDEVFASSSWLLLPFVLYQISTVELPSFSAGHCNFDASPRSLALQITCEYID